jgi:hypothetical protein
MACALVESRCLLSTNVAEALRRRAAGETLSEIAQSFNVSHMTIARIANDAR